MRFLFALLFALLSLSASAQNVPPPTLAAKALHAGLVDEIRLFLAPVIVGGGLRALPDGYRASLELVEQRRFEGGFVMLAYRTT